MSMTEEEYRNAMGDYAITKHPNLQCLLSDFFCSGNRVGYQYSLSELEDAFCCQLKADTFIIKIFISFSQGLKWLNISEQELWGKLSETWDYLL